ncbi:SPOR domain-containing protein [Pseudomonas sp. GX19020]|uniref:SPOR domain-containing protein n=1 Tax=Pseudomonas sp. GX19020 TaxID=2942277 RepID=UPI002019FEEF|nr:SPOR domain-containing protein [Pseudomonas sp. GX19020]MCL4066655.1 SPOR domain-containing protein [Pseudomonas sp. GX19020]
MSAKILPVAFLAAVCFAAPAFADLRGPAELPPAGYKGQQYVDSRGCVFLRAGNSGRATWVPRVARDRKQLCGYAPSGRPTETAEAAPAAVAPAAVPAAKSAGTTFSPPRNPGAPLPLPAPMQSAFEAAGKKPGAVASAPAGRTAATSFAAAKAPAAAPRIVTGTGAEGHRLACPGSAPVAQKFRVEGGGTRTLCTRGDGSLEGASFPRLVTGGIDSWAGTATAVATGQTITVTTRQAATASAVPPPPPGYKRAWEDDRLNPRRGQQTAKGIADQETVWTRSTPAELHDGTGRETMVKVRRSDGSTRMEPAIVTTAADGAQSVVLLAAPSISNSSKSTVTVAKPAAAPAAGGRIFVQVGTFGVTANAEGTAGRLKGLGLPVSRSTIRGGALHVVYAGPFASTGEARAALSQVRGAGFGDAVIVQ